MEILPYGKVFSVSLTRLRSSGPPFSLRKRVDSESQLVDPLLEAPKALEQAHHRPDAETPRVEIVSKQFIGDPYRRFLVQFLFHDDGISVRPVGRLRPDMIIRENFRKGEYVVPPQEPDVELPILGGAQRIVVVSDTLMNASRV